MYEAKYNDDLILDEGSLPAWGKQMSLNDRDRGFVLQDEAREILDMLNQGGEVFSKPTFVKLHGGLAWKRTVGPADKRFKMRSTNLEMFGALHQEDLESYWGTERNPKEDPLGLGPRCFFLHE